ncbi:protein SMAX1-LIKE 6-like [Malania oleifera]|uniref:protein SMAX1-LIKE 6-like n=1 Tax=Malania oleifera TaxID=397392 RepID=UPI0025AE0EB9|nr:protein SMAX1-LIKE 6-like [Malania oleifera]
MPTPVSLARQCLTSDAAHALDEAVAVARRRGHAQTTSLHAVSALLSLPSSALRDACSRARNSAFSTRIQFKALDLCLSVSLDRQPSTQRVDDPPVSNSLMAAIKRSQANQRRQPENFHLYQQMQQQQSSMSCVKVELQHMILSILDDPVVSRVFGEAGFRSCDIKLAIVRPLPQLLRYPRTRGPPLFLCNFAGDLDPGRRNFGFPFSGFSGLDEDSRRIGEVLARKKGRNPLLVGACANDALRSFSETVERRKGGVLPDEVSGLSIICVDNEILRYVSGNCDKGVLNLRFEEVGRMANQCSGPGLVVNYGDLKVFIGEAASVDGVRHVVAQLMRLLEVHGRRVWILGAAASYETYLMFMSRFPSIEKDWDLQLLPITSLRSSMGQSYSRSSLMESFVPFGGFFSTPSDMKGVSSSYQYPSRCQPCNEKCEQEITALSKGVFTASVADQYRSSLSSWLQMAEFGMSKGLDAVKAKDDGMVLNAKVAGLQKKWDTICQRLHHSQPLSEADIYQVGSQVPVVVGLQFAEDKKDNANNNSRNNINESVNENKCKNMNSCISADLRKISTSKASISPPLASEAKNEDFLSKLREKPSRAENPEQGGLSSTCSLSNSSVGDGRTSPTSATSVTTDLGLGIYPVPPITELQKPMKRNCAEHVQNLSGCISANVDLANDCVTLRPAISSSCSCVDFIGHFDPRDFKALSRALAGRVGWQAEALGVICQTIARRRTSNEKRHGASVRGDIWFNFLGPDRFGKKKIAVALAEILYGSRENFICVDLGSQNGILHRNPSIDLQDMNSYDIKSRGKTVIDYIVGELSKKPFSIVFLENVDKADLLAQSSLSRAIMTGKFPDSHGREVGSNNAIFVMTASRSNRGDDILPSGKESSNHSLERILRAKSCSMQILVHAHGKGTISHVSNPVFMNKRKLIGYAETFEQHGTLETAKRAHKASNLCLDLNLPAEENEAQNTDHGNFNGDCVSESSRAWLEDFSDLVDETVVFKPFDFDTLAENIMKDISEQLHKIVGSECSLEIDLKVMEQILAAACLSERDRVVEDWVEQILSKGFVEARKRYNLTTHTVVKLVACEGTKLDAQAPGGCLPTKIILN